MNFIKVKDNLLTKQECTETINWSIKNKSFQPDIKKDRASGYDYFDLMDCSLLHNKQLNLRNSYCHHAVVKAIQVLHSYGI